MQCAELYSSDRDLMLGFSSHDNPGTDFWSGLVRCYLRWAGPN